MCRSVQWEWGCSKAEAARVRHSRDCPGAHLGADPGHEETLPVVQHGLLQETLLCLALSKTRGEHSVSPTPWDTPLYPSQRQAPAPGRTHQLQPLSSGVVGHSKLQPQGMPEQPGDKQSGTEPSLFPAASPDLLPSCRREPLVPTAARTPETTAPMGHWGPVSPSSKRLDSTGSTQP